MHTIRTPLQAKQNTHPTSALLVDLVWGDPRVRATSSRFPFPFFRVSPGAPAARATPQPSATKNSNGSPMVMMVKGNKWRVLTRMATYKAKNRGRRPGGGAEGGVGAGGGRCHCAEVCGGR